MQAKVEISLYPLNNDFIEIIKSFISKLNSQPNIVVETNQLSTQLFGDYDEIMSLLTTELKDVYLLTKAVAVIKVIGLSDESA